MVGLFVNFILWKCHYCILNASCLPLLSPRRCPNGVKGMSPAFIDIHS